MTSKSPTLPSVVVTFTLAATCTRSLTSAACRNYALTCASA